MTLRAPIELAGCVREKAASGIKRNLEGTFSIATGAANGLVQGRVKEGRINMLTGEPPHRRMVRDSLEAKHAAELAGQAQKILQTSVVQPQPLSRQKHGE